ncbi:sensor histidine kinase [Deinococcus arenicola]|uniref:histidine kinase n=1 Tax=Deinococcus arenicola TaxID=2994950 RepID=A0ABU4DT10_9DEIO|nr:ATP-binding protein [Deinococcus sp. ZS9-10]MDV6375097.1 ATP-binding protein [Deinococcus sp. ZS9-10]
MTHSLQTPLRQFSSLAELVRCQKQAAAPARAEHGAEHGEGEDRRQNQYYLREMLGNVDRMNLLVTALADYFQSGRQASKVMSVNLGRVVAEVKKEFQAQFRGREIVWEQDPLPTVIGDPQTLKGMFAVLLDNAVKFSAERPRAEISILARENQHEYLIGVRDNGVGFNPGQQGRLFGIFQRLHSEQDFPGLGTGLALPKGGPPAS